jgi:hypothetical protein
MTDNPHHPLDPILQSWHGTSLIVPLCFVIVAIWIEWGARAGLLAVTAIMTGALGISMLEGG